MGVYGSAAYTHIDKDSGTITFYPPRQTLETVRRYTKPSREEERDFAQFLSGAWKGGDSDMHDSS
jgi:hypothetical protein